MPNGASRSFVPPVCDEQVRFVSVTDPISAASWIYADEFVAEDEILVSARERASAAGITPVSPGVGSALQFLTSVLDARAVIEVGTGTGVSGLWLLRGMRPDGVLTSIDIEAEHQRYARQAFSAAGVPTQRARTISGAALDVLTRLTDGAYDLMFVDGDIEESEACLTEALRLLRPGGVVAFNNALWSGKVPDPSQRDRETVAVRELGRLISTHDALVPLLLPIGNGLLLAKRLS